MPRPRPRSRRAVLVTVALAPLLVACGGGPAPVAAEGQTRTVTHARGQTEVPRDPQRIVVLEPVQLDTAVALGRIPVGAAVLSETTGIPGYLGPDAAGIATVGTVSAPSVERIAALRPDLILGTQARHGELYPRLSAIAPTVFGASQTDPWQDSVRFVGEVLGRGDGAATQLQAYRARCAEIAQRYRTEGRTAQLVRPRNGQLTLYGPASFAGSTLECAGFTVPPRDWEGSISVDLSPELVLQARADQVFVTAADPASPAAVPPALEAVRAQAFPRLTVVDQSFWITGVGPRGGMAVLDDIERILAAQPPG